MEERLGSVQQRHALVFFFPIQYRRRCQSEGGLDRSSGTRAEASLLSDESCSCLVALETPLQRLGLSPWGRCFLFLALYFGVP